MRILYKELVRLPVITVSGQKLGKIRGLVCDTEMLSIVSIEVRSSMRPARVLLISKDQIVSITEHAVTVLDSAVRVDSTALRSSALVLSPGE